jgi:hypothetical protein
MIAYFQMLTVMVADCSADGRFDLLRMQLKSSEGKKGRESFGLERLYKGTIGAASYQLVGNISINSFFDDLGGFVKGLLRAYHAQPLLHAHRDSGFGVKQQSIMYFWYVDIQS